MSVNKTLAKKHLIWLFTLFSAISFSQNSVDLNFKQLDSLCKVHMRNPDSLLVYSQKLLKYSEKNNMDVGKQKAHRLLGFTYNRLRNYENSNTNYYKSLAIAKSLNDQRGIMIVYNDLALNHRITKFYDSSSYYSYRLLDLYNNPKTKNYSPTFKTRGLNMTYMNLGQTYLLKNSLDSSEYFFSKAIKGFQETNNWRFASSSLTNLGDVLFQKKEYKRALIVLDSSQTIADNNNIKVNASKNYNLMARIHNKLGNEEAYNKYLELENKSRLKNLDKVTIGENNVSARKDNYKYELNKRIKLEEDKAFYKTNFFKVLLIILILVIIASYFYIGNKKSKAEINELQKQLDSYDNTNLVVTENNTLHLKSKAIIDTNIIQYIKSEGHYVEFFIIGKDKPEIDRNSLINVLEELPNNQFVRIHKSYIVNIKHIKIINSTKLMLNDGTWINLSRTYKQNLKNILNMS